jgi:prevent-host-death family protein
MEMVKKVSTLDARKRLGQLLEGVQQKGDQYVIERGGEPMAAVVPVWQLEDWQKRRGRFFGMVDDVWKRNKGVMSETIEQEVKTAVQNVRAKKPPRRKV